MSNLSLYSNAKIGLYNAMLGFSFVSIPTFITFFGSKTHKLETGQEEIITKLGISLIGLNMVSGIGQAIAPNICGEAYNSYCKLLARILSHPVQTFLFGQTATTGVVKGIVSEIPGYYINLDVDKNSWKGDLVESGKLYLAISSAEAIGTFSEPIFSDIPSKNLTNDFITAQQVAAHVYSAISCPHKVIDSDIVPSIPNIIFCAYVWSDVRLQIVNETANNLFKNYKDSFIADGFLSDEFLQ